MSHRKDEHGGAQHTYHAPKPCAAPVRRARDFSCVLPPLEKGQPIVLAPAPTAVTTAVTPLGLTVEYGPLAALAVGTQLVCEGAPLLAVTGRFAAPSLLCGAAAGPHALACFFAEPLSDHPGGDCTLTPQRTGISLAWITLSDKGSAGDRQDESGPLIRETLESALPLGHVQGFLIPDNPERLCALAADLALHQGFDLIVTSGGTGLGPRDTTPEALAPLLTRRLPGFEQAMMAASLAKTPHAAISRAIAGAMGKSLVITLPGSKKAVRENLEAVAPAIAHALAKLQGDPSDCAAAEIR